MGRYDTTTSSGGGSTGGSTGSSAPTTPTNGGSSPKKETAPATNLYDVLKGNGTNPGTGDSTTTIDTERNQTQTINETIKKFLETTGKETSTRENMTPEGLKALHDLIKQLQTGGTEEQKASRKKRDETVATTEELLRMISPDAAFHDAEGLMALNLQQAMEKNMPAIQRAIEGAGTSAEAMQGLLSQNMARDSALAAAALGGDQAKAYAAQRTGIASVLEMLTRPQNEVTTALLQALGINKGAVEKYQREFSSTTQEDTTRNQTMTGSDNEHSVKTVDTPDMPIGVGFGSGGGSSSPWNSGFNSGMPTQQNFNAPAAEAPRPWGSPTITYPNGSGSAAPFTQTNFNPAIDYTSLGKYADAGFGNTASYNGGGSLADWLLAQ